MRAVLLLVACSGCGDTPVLPQARVLSSNVVAFASFDRDLYWAEPDETSVALMRHTAGDSSTLWNGPLGYRDTVELVAGSDGVVLAENYVFENCGSATLVRLDGTSEPLPLLDDGSCTPRPLDMSSGQLLFQVRSTNEQVRRYSFATRAVDSCFDLEDGTLWSIVPADDRLYGLTSSGGEREIVAFGRDCTTTPNVLATTTGEPRGLVLGDDTLFWIINRSITERAQVYRLSPDREDTPTLVATLSAANASAVAWLDGDLWVAEPGEHALERVELGGAVTRFEVPYAPSSLAAYEGELAIKTFETEQPGELLLQPVP